MNNFVSVLCAAVLALSSGTSMSVAHRGAPDLAPENTVGSFAAAAEQGVDAIECDVRLTADGVLVCHHDESTGRVWSEDLAVDKTLYADLRALGLSHGFKAAYPGCGRVYIPTFAEGVAAMGKAHIFAEIKGGVQVAEALDEQIKQLGIAERVTVISYDRSAIEYMHGRGYDCALLLSCGSPSELLETELPAGVDVDVNHGALSRRVVDELHGRGLKVYGYTARGRGDYEDMVAMGVDGVTGDDFAFLK